MPIDWNHDRANHDLPDTDSYNPAASSLAGHVDPAVMAELLSIRSSIDNIDATLVYLLAERFKATQKVGFLKAAHRLPAGDPGRETAQIAPLRPPRRGRAAGPGIRGKAPELHHRRGHPAPRGDRQDHNAAGGTANVTAQPLRTTHRLAVPDEDHFSSPHQADCHRAGALAGPGPRGGNPHHPRRAGQPAPALPR